MAKTTKTKKKPAPRKPKPLYRDPNVVAAVEFVSDPVSGMIKVRTSHTDNCPPNTRVAATVAADLLFRECRKNGSVAVKINGEVVLAEPAVRDDLPLLGKGPQRELSGFALR